jgi:hypothetical protein
MRFLRRGTSSEMARMSLVGFTDVMEDDKDIMTATRVHPMTG